MSAPQVPQKPGTTYKKNQISNHKKSISTVSVRTLKRGNDLEERERQAAMGGKALRPLRMNSDLGRRGIELSPKPTDDSRDPLNWPTWKRESAYCSLLLATGVACILKTLYVTTNTVVATQFNTSYVGTVAFTGVPFMVAAVSSLATSVLSQSIGKRSIYIVSGMLMLTGAMWNMHIKTSYAQFMVSRVFQGIGWGSMEGLVAVSIRDMFFVHERSLRLNIHSMTTLLFTWGSPIAGGYISQTADGFRQAIMVITLIQAFSIFFLIALVPETSFSRDLDHSGTYSAGFKSYLTMLHPMPHRKSFSAQSALAPLRAMLAPTTLLTFLGTFPMIATAHGVANSLSLLFAMMPTFIFPSRLGYIFILPLVFSLFTHSILTLTSTFRIPKGQSFPMSEVIPGILLSVAGLLAFGIYTGDELAPSTLKSGAIVFLTTTAQDLSLKVVSALFGMLVAGAGILSYSASQHLAASSAAPAEETSRPLEVAHQFWESLFTGIFIMAVPLWIQIGSTGVSGLKDMGIALAVVQIVLGSSAAAVIFMKMDLVQRLDGKILGVQEKSVSVGRSHKLKEWSEESFAQV